MGAVDDALVVAQLKAEGRVGHTHASVAGLDPCPWAHKVDIVQVCEHAGALGVPHRGGLQLLEHWLDEQREEERGDRVALLGARAGRQPRHPILGAEEKGGVLAVEELGERQDVRPGEGQGG